MQKIPVMKKCFLLLAAALLVSCHKNEIEKVQRGAYYWKSDGYGIEKTEDSLAKKLGVQKLYVRFYDVRHDETMGNIPIAKTNIYGYHSTGYLDSVNIVPTVYLKNEVFLESSRAEIDTLVSNMVFLNQKFASEKFGEATKPVTEWQMDCDWTLKSRDNYFYFLQQIKRVSKKKISCTLRLYPYKYRDKMGIPPVDQVTLMCYNLLNPLEEKNRNSILDRDELAAYLDAKQPYPLHLDVALPMYSWMLHYQNNRFSHILQADKKLAKAILKPVRPLWFEVTRDTVVENVYLRVGDQVKYEAVSAQLLSETIQLLKDKIEFDNRTTVSFYHLDSKLIQDYTYEEFNRIYTAFNQ
jgi:hypothetical protein